ncbi:MAG: MipA/OmpV family protein, partial [Smithella sp.]
QRGLALFLILLVIFVAKNTNADEKPLWEAGIGGALLLLPDYRGSDEYRLYALPYPYFVYRGDKLKVDERRISGRFFKTDRVLLDFSLYGSVPVKSSNNTARTGMPDLDPTFEIGPALRIFLIKNKKEKLSLNLPVRALFSTDFSSLSREGWIFSPRLELEEKDIFRTGLKLGISAGPMFTDSSYNTYFYNVEPFYAIASRPAYSAGGGYGGSTLTVGLSKEYKQFVFNVFASADFLQGAVFEDSPLVKRKTSFMSGFNLSWIFAKSAKTVVSDID